MKSGGMHAESSSWKFTVALRLDPACRMQTPPSTAGNTSPSCAPARADPGLGPMCSKDLEIAEPAFAEAKEEPGLGSEPGAQLVVANNEQIECCSCNHMTAEAHSIIVVRAKTKTSKDIRRCKQCHNLRARCERIANRHGALVGDWTQLKEEDKRMFYDAASKLAGNDLLSKMQELHNHEIIWLGSACVWVGMGWVCV